MNTLKRIATPTFLFICGAILLTIGLSITLSPESFYAETMLSGSAAIGDANLFHNASLINELRAPAGMLLAACVFVVLACMRKSLRTYAWLLSAMIYLPYGLARVYGFLIDGLPHQSLVYAAALEILLGAMILALFLTKKGF